LADWSSIVFIEKAQDCVAADAVWCELFSDAETGKNTGTLRFANGL
jgi:hypothetical protein